MCRPARRSDDRIEFVLVHDCINSLGTREFSAFFKCVEIGFIGQGAALFGTEKCFLPEMAEFLARIPFVKDDEIRKGFMRAARP